MKSCAKKVVVEQPSEGASSMGKPIPGLSYVTTVGLELAKHVFQVHGSAPSIATSMRRCSAKLVSGTPRRRA
jgi:hypothetical protein